jgi:hypothetical protein
VAELMKRLKNTWNAFLGRNPTEEFKMVEYSPSYSIRPDRTRLSYGVEKSIVTTIYNRIAVDVSIININHVRLDENNNFKEIINSKLNWCLSVEANLDQTARNFIMDVVISMFDEGYVAIVPVETQTKNNDKSSYDILQLRTGKITQWYPKHVKVQVYNELSGKKEEIILPKSFVGIVENPFYYVMNEPNSTLKRLIRTLNQIDRLDDRNASGKIDLIVQLPYPIRSESRKNQAEERRAQIEEQLTGSKYGIAYTDGTERITQLNRPVENNLWQQAQDLTSMLFTQLGITQSILDCTADEKTMNNYLHSTIEPILMAIIDEMNRKFLSKTARTQRQSIRYYMDLFRLIPVTQIATVADTFTRNAILTSNEFRGIMGLKPSDDPVADELSNKNLIQPEGDPYAEVPPEEADPYAEAPPEDDGGFDLTNF